MHPFKRDPMKYSNDPKIRAEGFRLEALDAAQHHISMAVSALATLRDRSEPSIDIPMQPKSKELVQNCIDELGTVDWHVRALK